MSLQMLSSWLLFGIKHTLWLLSAVCLQRIPHQTSPHAEHRPAHSPGDSKSRLKSRLTLYDLVIFIWQYQIATTGPSRHPDIAREWNWDSHTSGEICCYHAQQLLGKSPECFSPAHGFFSHSWWNLHSISLFPLLSLSGVLDIYAGENYYFSISRSAKKKKKKALSHSSILNSILFHSSLSVCHLLPSTSTISDPPAPTFSASFFLIPSPVCLPLVLVGVCSLV